MLPTSDTMSRVKLAMQRALADALPGVIPHPPRPSTSADSRPARLSREELQRLFGQELAGPAKGAGGSPKVIVLAPRRTAAAPPPLLLGRTDGDIARTGS